jgi:hypothetical protein
MKLFAKSSSRKSGGQKNPEEVIRTFLRVLERIAPRPNGGRGPASTVVREKP